MDLYNTLKRNKSMNKHEFAQMMQEFFEYTDIDDNDPDDLDWTTYSRANTIILESDRNKRLQLIKQYPLILKTFLLKPQNFSEFLDTIFETALRTFDNEIRIRDSDTYITQLICCATFHLCKLFTMFGDKISTVTKDDLHSAAAKYYQLPLSNWLSKLIMSLSDDSSLHYVTNAEDMLNEIHYLLLMSFVSKELKIQDRPFVKYLSAIKRKWTDPNDRFFACRIWLHDVVSLLTQYENTSLPDTESYSDLFDDQLRSIYHTNDYIQEKGLISWTYFVDPDDFENSVFCNHEYTMTDFLDPQFINRKDTDIIECLHNYPDGDTIPFFVIMIYCVGPQIMFDISAENRVIMDRNANDILELVYFMLNSTNLDRDATFLFAMLFRKKIFIYDDLLMYSRRSLIHKMIENCYYIDRPATLNYIRKFFKVLFTGNYSNVFKSNAKYYEFLKGHEKDELLGSYQGDTVLLKLLKELHIPTDTLSQQNTPLQSLSLNRSVFQDFNQSITYSPLQKIYSFENPSPIHDNNDNAFYFKDVIKNLLKFEEKNSDVDKDYLKTLYEYKESLKNMFGINLDDYKFMMIPDSPMSLSVNSKRSVDKTSSISMRGPRATSEENIFKKRIPIVYQKPHFKTITVSTSHNKKEKRIKIGNAIYKLDEVSFINEDTIQLNTNQYALADIPFHDEKLLKSLLKHYSRSVEGMTENEYGGPDRIIKIRKYLQSKYPTQTREIIIHTEENKELDRLLEKWETFQIPSTSSTSSNPLNTMYYIKYYKMVKDVNGNLVKEFNDGIDEGGLTKNFFTKCVKQLKSRFFKEAYNGSNRYILNADGLKNVQFIAKLLSILILKEIYLDFNLSILYLAFIMFERKHISNEEIFLYFLLDIDTDTRYNSYLKYCENNYEYKDDDDPNYYFAMACNADIQVSENLNYIYNLNAPQLDYFFKSFLFNNKIFYRKFKNINSKIRIYDLDKLISIGKLSKKELKIRIFDKIMLSGSDATVFSYMQDLMIHDTKHEYMQMYNDYKQAHLSDFESDNKKMMIFSELENSQTFKKKVLMFWSGSEGILSEEYKVFIDPDLGIMPVAHTCFNQIDLPTADKIISKNILFNSFMDIFIGSAESQFSNH